MRKVRSILVLFFLSLMHAGVAHAQWVQTNGPYGGMIISFAVSGTNLFAGTWGGGVFLSTNNGTNWTSVNDGLTNTNVSAIAVSGTNLFAGTGGGVFLSTNNGTSWTEVNNGLTSTSIQALAVSGTNLFAGIVGGVFRSANNGTSWTAVKNGLPDTSVPHLSVNGTNSWVFALAVSGTNLFAGTASSGVFLSTNNGTNWTAVNMGLTNTSVRSLAVDTNGAGDTNLFAGTYGGGVFLSTNNGTSWTAVNNGLTNTNVSAFAVSGTNLFAGTYDGGVFLSTNNGTSWTAVNDGLANKNVSALAVSGTNLFAGTRGGGVFLSTNNGETSTATGLTNPSAGALAVSGTNLLAGTGGGGSGNHLISNKEYRSKVESSFKEREQLAHHRKDKLFNVFGSGLSLQQEEALKFLFAYMPLNDLADYDGDFFLANANIALKTRNESPWGKSIPEDIFLHYVLPFRVVNENLDSFRIAYYDEIQARVKGMDATDAALEINHWCHEKVTYQKIPGSNTGPVTTILSAWGKCGTESIFTVASLRTAGLPARWVFLPLLAHKDNWDHAWVEVWIDGKWHYMGACSPQPVLDWAGHTEIARRAMLTWTWSFGAKDGQENTTECYRTYSLVNALSKYAVTKTIKVKVLDTNNVPVKDALVEYLLYTSAQFRRLAEVPTDEFGISQFETGLGDLLIWARKGDDFNFKHVSVSDIDTLDLILNLKPADNSFQELDLGVPIVREPLTGPATELIAANTKRTNEEDMIRQAYIDSWMKPEEAANLAKELGADPEIVKDLIRRSMGNYKSIASFLTHTPALDRSLAITLLKQVSDQDLRDTKEEIFADHLNNVIRFENTHGAYDYELYSQYVLNPSIPSLGGWRIVAWRKHLFESMPAGFRQDAINDPSILIKYVNNNIVITPEDSEVYFNHSPKGVDELKVSDSHYRDIYFVALCRSLGIPSRLEPGSNVPQYYFKKEWHDVWFAGTGRNQPLSGQGFIRFSSGETNPVPKYNTHFTIARFENGRYKTVQKRVDFKDELALVPGHYMLVTGNRINDSKILSSLSFFELKENEHKAIDIKSLSQ